MQTVSFQDFCKTPIKIMHRQRPLQKNISTGQAIDSKRGVDSTTSYPFTTTRCFRYKLPGSNSVFSFHTKVAITTKTSLNETAACRSADASTFGKTRSISLQSTALQAVWITSKFKCSQSSALPSFYQCYRVTGSLKSLFYYFQEQPSRGALQQTCILELVNTNWQIRVQGRVAN